MRLYSVTHFPFGQYSPHLDDDDDLSILLSTYYNSTFL